jgi:hypothetical protein
MKEIDAAATEFLANTRIAVTSVSRHPKSHGSMTHAGPVCAVAFSPDGRHVVSGDLSRDCVGIGGCYALLLCAPTATGRHSGSPGLLRCGDRRVCTTSPTFLERSWKAKGAIGGEWARYLQIVIQVIPGRSPASAISGEDLGTLDKLGVTGSSPVPPIMGNPRKAGGFIVSERVRDL